MTIKKSCGRKADVNEETKNFSSFLGETVYKKLYLVGKLFRAQFVLVSITTNIKILFPESLWLSPEQSPGCFPCFSWLGGSWETSKLSYFFFLAVIICWCAQCYLAFGLMRKIGNWENMNSPRKSKNKLKSEKRFLITWLHSSLFSSWRPKRYTWMPIWMKQKKI